MDATGITVNGKSLPHPLAIQQASLTLAPQHAKLKSFNGTVGSSDVQATGSLDNLLGFVLQDDTLRGTATVHSNRFNLDEWKTGGGDLQIIPVPPKIDFTLDATVAKLTYDKLEMTECPWTPSHQGSARDARQLHDEHPGRTDRRQRLVRDDHTRRSQLRRRRTR